MLIEASCFHMLRGTKVYRVVFLMSSIHLDCKLKSGQLNARTLTQLKAVV